MLGTPSLAPNGAPIAGNVLPDLLLDYRAFLKGEKVSPLGNSWVSKLDDRFDAEHYVRREAASAIDVREVGGQIAERLRLSDALNTNLLSAPEELADVEGTVRTLAELLEEVSERVRLNPDESYRLVGVSAEGRGAFVRESKLGREIKAKSLFRIAAGLIIYNRLFAFKGSFALANEVHDGAFASGEFPMFKVRDDVQYGDIIARYIVGCLNSPAYRAVVDRLSTGSTKESRNRFNQKLFLGLSINVPHDGDRLARIVALLEQADDLRREQDRLLKMSKEMHEGVLALLPKPPGPKSASTRESPAPSRRTTPASTSTRTKRPKS